MSDDNVYEFPSSEEPSDEEIEGTGDEAVVEVTESELNDLGAFLQQVQVVLLGHEAGLNEAFERLDRLEENVYGTSGSGSSDEGDPDGADGSVTDAGAEIADVSDDTDAA